ncbi:DsbA family protein [Endozoicomonas ascidiicola]|uniref:DsbA family protein n=1 Tax=Endozoicomonas ascidiicola TaxID=1698521 RepID=UPI000A56150F|nr:DsbA family protein [Endozoicomonas ascidiicola]
MPWVARLLSSNGFLKTKRAFFAAKRHLQNKEKTLDVYLSISDPYSYLLIQVLPTLIERLHVKAKIIIVRDKQPEMFPKENQWQTNATNDARHLAKLYQLTYPINPPAALDIDVINHYTVQLLKAANNIDRCQTLFDQYWHNEPISHRIALDATQHATLLDNQKRQQKQGHYSSAMIYFEGEWYWGLDRLIHLEHRLAVHQASANLFNRQNNGFLQRAPHANSLGQTITMYYSARSPYSYLGLEKAVKLCRQHQCRLEIKPVLPMLMRGLQVPHAKKMYIFNDTRREAELADIPYGYVADLLGKAVENCYALFDYACEQNKEIDFLLSFGRAVNSQGMDASSSHGIRKIVERCGLDWEKAQPLLETTHWHHWAEQNQQALSELGLWGVPCFQYRDLVTWGQDRLWLIEQALQNQTTVWRN